MHNDIYADDIYREIAEDFGIGLTLQIVNCKDHYQKEITKMLLAQ